MKTLLTGLLVLGVLFVGRASGVGASPDFGTASYIPHFGVHPAPLTINAASDFTCGAITCADYEAGVNGYLQDVAADSGGSNNVYSVATEYFDDHPDLINPGPISYADTFAGTFEDTHRFPADGCAPGVAAACLTESQLVAEIKKDMTANGWQQGAEPPQNLFVILLPSGVDTCDDGGFFCASNTFCAYHDFAGNVVGGPGVIFAVEPFNADYPCSGASEPTNPQGLPNGAEIDETVNTLSHETNEAITDPEAGTGWTSPEGNENGDLCAWWFGDPLGTTGGQPYNQVINGHDYSLQQEFSNSANAGAGGCLQHAGGTASTASPYVGGDTGPLFYDDGYVMRSANVYTIFWIPGPVPAITTAPVVKGPAAVGRTLTTTTGTWTNSPTGYTYKWQRCNTAGAQCVPIAAATSPSYTVLSGDAGHTIRSVVMAHNDNGSALSSAVSDPTAVVISRPTVITQPVISGTAQSGMTLSVSPGTWTNSPTKYTYQWLRCSASGTSCTAISTALSHTYTVKPADVGHVLAARVTASNAAGKRSTTVKTGVVSS